MIVRPPYKTTLLWPFVGLILLGFGFLADPWQIFWLTGVFLVLIGLGGMFGWVFGLINCQQTYDGMCVEPDPEKCEFCLGAKGAGGEHPHVYGRVVVCDLCEILLDRIGKSEDDDFETALRTIATTKPLFCSICGNPAACIGRYELAKEWTPACDECCGHGNEDGVCRRIEEINR